MYISHNHLAGYAETVGVIALSIALWGRTKLWIRLLVGYGAVVCYVGVVIAGSRGGYLSTIVSLVVFALLSLAASAMAGRDKAILGTVAVVGFVVMAAAGAAALMSHNFALDQKLKRITSDEIRSSLWIAAWDQFHTSPTVGTGAGTHLYYGRLFRQPTVESDPVHVHCDYLELLAEYGVVGAVGMILFLVAHVGRGVYAVRWLTQKALVMHEHGSSELGFQIGALSAIAALVAHSLVDFNLHIPGNALVCAFFFAVLANPGVEQSNSVAAPKGWVAGLRFVLPALGLWFFAWGVAIDTGRPQWAHAGRSWSLDAHDGLAGDAGRVLCRGIADRVARWKLRGSGGVGQNGNSARSAESLPLLPPRRGESRPWFTSEAPWAA